MLTKNGSIRALDKILQDSDCDAKIRVAKNDPATADEDLVLADLTEATFGGYAAISTAGVFGGSALNGADQAESNSGDVVIEATGSGLPQTCYLAYIDFKDAGDTRRLLFVKRFPAPQTVSVAGNEIRFKFFLFCEDGTP
jgi:hypothetical protein